MLHIILLILKIIGIILLCILAVLLLAVCCVLFVPVRYRIEAFREESEGNPPFVVRAKITWLLHLVNVLACYPADIYVRVRIFLFPLFRIPEAEKRQEEEAATGRKRRGKKKSGQKQEEPVVEAPQENRELPGCQDAEENEVTERIETIETTENAETVGPDEDSGPVGGPVKALWGLCGKIREFFGKIKAAIQNMRYTINRICDKIESALHHIQYYLEILQGDPFRQSWALCKEQVKILLKALKPDQFVADLIIGTGDPASTGEILAACGMLYPLIGSQVRIVGDFEKTCLEGNVTVKGKIRAFTFLRVAWKVYRNKDIRTLMKLFKKEAV